MILIIGTPDSGKSALAESLVCKLSKGEMVAYIATMIPFDEEGKNRIERHRKLREGKNFMTFEEPFCVSNVIEKIHENKLDTALLECTSNLVGNVMHKPGNVDVYEKYGIVDEIIDGIVSDILSLSKSVRNLVVVANYFENNAEYDEDTTRYVSVNNAVNERLKEISDAYYISDKISDTVTDNMSLNLSEKSSNIPRKRLVTNLEIEEKGWTIYENN